MLPFSFWPASVVVLLDSFCNCLGAKLLNSRSGCNGFCTNADFESLTWFGCRFSTAPASPLCAVCRFLPLERLRRLRRPAGLWHRSRLAGLPQPAATGSLSCSLTNPSLPVLMLRLDLRASALLACPCARCSAAFSTAFAHTCADCMVDASSASISSDRSLQCRVFQHRPVLLRSWQRLVVLQARQIPPSIK
jgi:hypothetical protein